MKKYHDLFHNYGEHPYLIWRDERLCSFNCERSNKNIYLKAAGRTFEKLTRYNEPQISDQQLESEK